MRIDILGAGIGGLTTAVALEQKQIDYRIFESAKEIKLAGTGIILANNAMQIFEKLGLRSVIEDIGNPISSMNITSKSLAPISKVDLSYFEDKYGVKNMAIHRGTLQKILLEHIDSNKLYLNKRLTAITEKENSFILNFKDETQEKSDYVIGSDGINSVVRKSLFTGTQIRKAKQICWRGVTNYKLPKELMGELNEAWFDNKRFGFVQIAKDKVYWYALKSFENSINEHTKEDLSVDFKKFHPVINELIAATAIDEIHTDEITDLKPISNWIKGNACLLGDAAHAMTPNMGQGACQAIEDAYVLSECISKYSIERALEQYQSLRISKAKSLVNVSWNIGKMAHVKNPLFAKCINLMMKNTPASISKMQSDKIFKIATI